MIPTTASDLPPVEAPKPQLQLAQRVFVWTSVIVLFGLWGFAISHSQEQKWICFAFITITLGYLFSISSAQMVTLITGGKVMEAVALATGVIASAETAATTALNAATTALGGTPPAAGGTTINVNPSPAPMAAAPDAAPIPVTLVTDPDNPVPVDQVQPAAGGPPPADDERG